MSQMPQISEAEFLIMKVVWEMAPINTNEITEEVLKNSDWSPKTVQTLIKRLVNKGALSYEKSGRVFVYTPEIDQKEYIRYESNNFLKRFYGGNITALLSNFIESGSLSQNDISQLKALLSYRDSGASKAETPDTASAPVKKGLFGFLKK
ncbi:MAG: BlaI/MecI/CopY family transcriptional regulator [Lachnospiraceae bacterium]|nr:BlaI/MecI/CopY family transcriptional regulator [Lachnospiraceae bacterium]